MKLRRRVQLVATNSSFTGSIVKIEPELICHLVDCSARELTKVVPSRDITPCRRKEPLMRRLPNGTSYRFGDTHISEKEPAELKHLSRQRKRNQ